MKKLYQVVHNYDVDGGYGDAIPVSDVIMVFEDIEDAKAFVKRFAKPHVYYIPYAELVCGLLDIIEINVYEKDELDLDKVDPVEKNFIWLEEVGEYYGSVEKEIDDRKD